MALNLIVEVRELKVVPLAVVENHSEYEEDLTIISWALPDILPWIS